MQQHLARPTLACPCWRLASPNGRKHLKPGRLLFLYLEICSPFSSTPQYPLLSTPPPMWFSERKEQMGFSRRVTTCLLHLPSPLSMPSGGSVLWLPWQLCRGNLLLLEGQRCTIWVMLGWPVLLWPLFSRHQRAAFSTWVMDLETLECLLQLWGLSASP